MLTDQENIILEQIRNSSYETLLKGKDKNGVPFLKNVFDLHYKLFKETCTNCPNKIAGYIQKLKTYKFIEKMENTSNFKLKKGVLIVVPGTSNAFTESNLTDEVAVWYLAKNINRKANFDDLPDDFEDLVNKFLENQSNEVEKAEKEAEEKTKAEAEKPENPKIISIGETGKQPEAEEKTKAEAEKKAVDKSK
jgi:hypothetical protein